MKKNDIDIIKEQAKRLGLSKASLAYILATTEHETGGVMKPVREKYNGTPQEYFKNYSGGWKYFGRGYVQLTHDYNYRWAQDNVVSKMYKGVDITKDPDWLLQDTDQARQVNASIMIKGMMSGQFGRPLKNFTEGGKTDFYRARQSVNSRDFKTYAPIEKKARTWMTKLEGY